MFTNNPLILKEDNNLSMIDFEGNNFISTTVLKRVEVCKCPHILIVDDDPFNLIALEGLIQ